MKKDSKKDIKKEIEVNNDVIIVENDYEDSEDDEKENNNNDNNNNTNTSTKEKKINKDTKNAILSTTTVKSLLRHTNSIMVLGNEEELDDMMEWRLKWGQRGLALFTLFGFSFYIIGTATNNAVFRLLAATSFVLAMCFVGLICHKNVSLTILKLIIKQPDVVIILALGIGNFIIELVKPLNSLSWMMAVMYIVMITTFIFMDALIIKSRSFMITVLILFVGLHFYLISRRIFGLVENGVPLVTYTINGETTTLWKRDIKRTIYVQILLFSVKGIKTMLSDKDTKLIMWANGHIYRESGTSSPHVEDKRYSLQYKKEATPSLKALSKSISWTTKSTKKDKTIDVIKEVMV